MRLSDTIDLMNSPDYRDRMKAEYLLEIRASLEGIYLEEGDEK